VERVLKRRLGRFFSSEVVVEASIVNHDLNKAHYCILSCALIGDQPFLLGILYSLVNNLVLIQHNVGSFLKEFYLQNMGSHRSYNLEDVRG
jgi:hypothetical protein